MQLRYSLTTVIAVAFGCAPNTTASAPAAAPALAGDWVARGAAAVRVSDDADDVRDCEFVSMLAIPGGWDGVLEHMTAEERDALDEMKVATVRAGGNFILTIPGSEPLAEAYLCTE